MAEFIGVIYFGETRGMLNQLFTNSEKNNWQRFAEHTSLEIYVPAGQPSMLKVFQNDEYICYVSGNVFIDSEITRDIHDRQAFHVEKTDENCLPYYFANTTDTTFEHLKGDFNILLYDKIKHSVTLITSRFGMLPLYYYQGKDYLLVSTKICHLTASGLVTPEPDEISWLEHFVFNHFPGDYTGVKNVRLFPSAAICTARKNEPLGIKKYWHTISLLQHQKPLQKKDSLDLMDETIARILRRMISRSGRPAVTLTGGWDGRLVLSYLTALKADFFLYSFGAENSADINIPKKISSDLGFLYMPVILNDHYLNNHFLNCADRTIVASDGIRSFTRAHYLYGIDQISNTANYLISGNCGSNILKTSKKPNQLINANLLQLIYDGEVTMQVVNRIKAALGKYPFFEVKNNLIDDLLSRLTKYDVCNQRAFTANQRYYIFLLDEIERKYFGMEAQTYRQKVTNFSVFIDYEFMVALSKTVFFGVNLPFYHNDIRYKYLTTWLYASLMRKKNPVLAAYPSDKGFSLDEALNPVGKIKALYYKYYKKYLRQAVQTDTYNTNPTIAIFKDHLMTNGLLNENQYSRMNHLDKNKLADCLSWLYWNAQLHGK